MKKLLAASLLCAFAVVAWAQSQVSTNSYTFLHDREGRCVFGRGVAAPSAIVCQPGALFWRSDELKFYQYGASGWTELSLGDLLVTDDATIGDDADVVGDLTAGTIASDAGVTATTRFVATPSPLTVADSGDGSPAAGTVTTTSEVVHVTCSDADGCALTLSETGAVSGAKVFIVNIGTNSLTIADSAGVQETTGALTLGANDNVWFCYVPSAWVQCMAVTNVA